MLSRLFRFISLRVVSSLVSHRQDTTAKLISNQYHSVGDNYLLNNTELGKYVFVNSNVKFYGW